MSVFYGENLKISIFGESHSEAIGVTVDGLPAGFRLDLSALESFMSRRSPGKNVLSSARKEADTPEFICGMVNNTLCGTALTVIIRNKDAKSSDYDELRYIPRPGHADLTGEYKFHGAQDARGGGSFSGRMTAPLCVAGGIAMQILKEKNINISAHIKSIKDIYDVNISENAQICDDFPVIDIDKGAQMQKAILDAKENGDSVGGTVECIISGMPMGVGGSLFDGLEGKIAGLIFAIPAVKGIEFGAGFHSAELYGSENNDEYTIKDGKIYTETNNCGGILGGISNGMPIVFRCAFKPTPSIAKPQKSVNLRTMSETTLEIKGRHDPCIVPRAVPVVEACAAIAVLDAIL